LVVESADCNSHGLQNDTAWNIACRVQGALMNTILFILAAIYLTGFAMIVHGVKNAYSPDDPTEEPVELSIYSNTDCLFRG
jgi:hypothetical protein